MPEPLVAEPLLEARNLVVGYDKDGPAWGKSAASKPVLNDVSFAIDRGEMLGIVGESGSGKTTLGRTLLGLVAPRSGTIRFDGMDVTNLDEARRRPLRSRIQMIFQDPMSALNPRHRVGRILGAPLLLHKIASTNSDAERLVAEVLGKVGLNPGFAQRYPHELSGGQRQRLGIARAILLKPDFILADEIVSGLDVSTQAQVLNLLVSLQKELGLAIAFISHDLSVIRLICDRVMVMKAGEVVEEGPSEAVFTAPRSSYTRRLLDAIPLPMVDLAWLAK